MANTPRPSFWRPTKVEYDAQLVDWAAGNPRHLGDKKGGECCPDFSCCDPELLAPESVRKSFMAASVADRNRFLAAFLTAFLAKVNKRVYVAGREPQ